MEKNAVMGTAEELSAMLVSAVRYALGRMTYIVGMTYDFMEKNKHLLTDKDLWIIISDIDFNEKKDMLGMECDKKYWLRLKVILEQEQENRKLK